MTALIVIGSIALIFLLIGLVRAGVTVEYSSQGLQVKAKLGPFKITVFPLKKREAKGKEKPTEHKTTQDKEGGSIPPVKQMLPLITDAAGQFRRHIVVDCIHLDFTAASQDPFTAAMSYGYVNAAIGMIWPLLAHNLTIKKHEIHTNVDFLKKEPAIYLYAAFSISIGRSLVLAASILIRFMKLLTMYKSEQKSAQAETQETKQKEAV